MNSFECEWSVSIRATTQQHLTFLHSFCQTSTSCPKFSFSFFRYNTFSHSTYTLYSYTWTMFCITHHTEHSYNFSKTTACCSFILFCTTTDSHFYSNSTVPLTIFSVVATSLFAHRVISRLVIFSFFCDYQLLFTHQCDADGDQMQFEY